MLSRTPRTVKTAKTVMKATLTILATSYRSAEAPSRQKCRKSASESAGPKRGASESAEKVLRPSIGRTPKGAYSTRGRSRHLLETPFSEPLLRTLLRTLFYCKTHSRKGFSEPF